MQDPGYGIHRELAPHVHLLSTYRYPLLHQVHHEKVAQMLLQAPKIARDSAPFYWTYLDRPPSGTILLTWQPLNILGTDFASDGFIWAPTETAFQMEVNVDGGVYTLELYQAKVGYAPGEPVAIHSRKRYRLLPGKYPSPNGHTPDPALWIVHYSDVAQQDRIPSNMIPIDMRTNTVMTTRQYLQTQGQIVQKEFMLHDRSNWPQIQFPKGPAGRQPMYGQSAPPVRVPQQMAYPVTHPGPPPAKRTRTHHAPGPAAGSMNAVLDSVDEDEDTSRGDIFDIISPREISTERYKLNHLWMEEVISSPYAIHQIIPQDLGLGLKGELAGVTEGLVDAPMDPDTDTIKHEYVGRLDAGKADEFRKRVKEQIEKDNVEMEKMKAKHAKRMAKFKKGSAIARAELELRSAVHDPTDIGPEYWRLEGKIEEEDGEEDKEVAKTPSKIDDILAQVQSVMGRNIATVKELQRIQDGGYEETAALPSRRQTPASQNGSHQSARSGFVGDDANMNMGGSTASSMLDQFQPGLSSTSTPGNHSLNFPTPLPQTQPQSSTGTPVNLSHPAPHPPAQGATPVTSQPDVEMANTSTASEPANSGDVTGISDWVVVPPGGVSPRADASASTSGPNPDRPTQGTPPQISTNASAEPASTNATPAFDADPNDFGDLGDLDSAGDALAEYRGGESLGGDLGLDMDMDDSAFGDAFHGVESRGTDGDAADGDVM